MRFLLEHLAVFAPLGLCGLPEVTVRRIHNLVTSAYHCCLYVPIIHCYHLPLLLQLMEHLPKPILQSLHNVWCSIILPALLDFSSVQRQPPVSVEAHQQSVESAGLGQNSEQLIASTHSYATTLLLLNCSNLIPLVLKPQFETRSLVT
jgi:hypothetical protein